MNVKILALGDVVGERGTKYISGGRLSRIRSQLGADLVIANGENSAKGNGLSVDSANALFDAGVDIITGGNHTWQKNQVYSLLDEDSRLIRPANFPGAAPGAGFTYADVRGIRVLIVNLSGNAFMLEPVASPYEWADKIFESERGKFDVSIVDFHAEATSEKIAMGWYLDGRASAVFGTHTHVQTADARVLPKGTGYVTDIGMCGSMNGVLGIKTECILHKFLVHTPCRFEEAEGDEAIHGALFEIDPSTGRCLSVATIQR
ncbi:MAG: TIGR00282 family metallophosphoesterase [Clostridia bacterium]|nr:TIGR00282 family metallophosphoesterase [Clostridia bacterium]